MTSVSMILSLAFALFSALAQSAQTPAIAGRWEGAIDVAGANLPFAVVFTPGATTLEAAIDIQGAKGVPLRAVSLAGNRVHFELPAGPGVATFDGVLEADAISGTFEQGPARGKFTLTRAGAPKPPEPAGPPPPYRVEDVTFANGGVTLAGTLTIPQGRGPFPALIMVTGSGAQNRDEELFGFKVFATIADHLTRRGIAVLRYDDRGVGGSSGNIAASTTADFAGDALAGLTLLAARPEIDKARLGVFGHSEGADVAAIAASRSPQVAFIVMMAGVAISGEAVLAGQQADGIRALGGTAEQLAIEQAAFRKVAAAVRSGAAPAELAAALREQIGAQYDTLAPETRAALGDRGSFIEKTLPMGLAQLQSAWMRYFISFDPAPVLAAVRCPVLAIFGERDTQVPPATNRPALEAAFAKGGNSRVTVKVYPEANHLFIAAKTGLPSEYASLPKTFVPGFLDDISAWLLSVGGGRR